MVFSSGVFAEAPGLLPRITTPLPIAQRKHAHVRFTCRHELPFCFGVFFFIKWYLLAIWTYKTQARIDLRVRLSTALSHHRPAKHTGYACECQQPGTKTAPCLRLHRRAAVFLMHPHLPIYLNLKQEKKKKESCKSNTLHRAPVGQGLLPPRPARAFGFWSLRALARARRGRVYV